MKKYITLWDLKSIDACAWSQQEFFWNFGLFARITLKNIRKAYDIGLNPRYLMSRHLGFQHRRDEKLAFNDEMRELFFKDEEHDQSLVHWLTEHW